LKRFPTNAARLTILWARPQAGKSEPQWEQEPPFGPDESPYPFIEDNIVALAEAQPLASPPFRRTNAELEFESRAAFKSEMQRFERKERKRAEEEARRQEKVAQLADERRRRMEKADDERRAFEIKKAAEAARRAALPGLSRPRLALPGVPVAIKLAPLAFQDTAIPLSDLDGFALRERAALWWVSNQSDDLLCLPECRIERLEYQVRTALRVLGPLHGRALLSDEVGLGKTIEAGLVTKELFTRGMVKRFLVLTLPSLVDQWAEELTDKFGLATVTTNDATARSDPARFWRDNPGIVASLHTLKQPAQLEVARQVHWDMLIVDEAHYLRNRTSQAWQAVNVLPRQFLLLLTATPVQNSLEELYNLVTLLQPGQLPSPKEFRARFLDPKNPRQPREPEELRRLLGQVMIRNTRANSGIELPPRRAETIVFTPDATEAEFWREWEAGFRVVLGSLGASQASLWGRLLLQAAGSSPAAWRGALEKFPDADAARAWRDRAPLEASWRRKCELLVPLTRGQNGAVIFTQFLDTQAAVAGFLRAAGVEAFVINGSTPAAGRQPITEQFHQRGGALLLTHSGTEGRNLQFCHVLANFDLPWNPMEIEQRIGRLHRLGQKQPVRICNFVQAGTLQEHLLEVLQEKLNLFELVVGETGLVLGERYSGDEFEEEVFRRWRESDGNVAEAIAGFGEELADARGRYKDVKELDETLFAQDFESL
ncbi:MAG: DEAD/DEAH box helicase, partial [Opitutaceae bacterium]